MAKEPKEKKSKVKKVKEKPEKTKEKKKKKAADSEEEEEGGGGGKKKLIIVAVLLLLILGGGAGCAYFLVYLPMTQAGEEEASTTLEPVLQAEEQSPSGYYGYLSHNAEGSNQLFVDGVDIIFASQPLLMEQMGLTADQMTQGYYISNPQAATRLIYVDQGTVFQIISRDTGNYEEVTWSQFVTHLSTSSILFEFTSFNNILLTVTEFPVNNFELPQVEELPPAPEEEVVAEEEISVPEETPEVPELPETPEGETPESAVTPEGETPDSAVTPEPATPDTATEPNTTTEPEETPSVETETPVEQPTSTPPADASAAPSGDSVST